MSAPLIKGAPRSLSDRLTHVRLATFFTTSRLTWLFLLSSLSLFMMGEGADGMGRGIIFFSIGVPVCVKVFFDFILNLNLTLNL